MAAGSQFTLRFHNDRLRELVRDVAEQLDISQNELVENAVEHLVVLQGALLADDLERAAKRLKRLSTRAHAELVAHSVDQFATGEANPDPIRARAVHTADSFSVLAGSMIADPFGVAEAFRVTPAIGRVTVSQQVNTKVAQADERAMPAQA